MSRHGLPRYTPFMLSLVVCPGAGQLANHHWFKGALLVAVSLGLTAWFTLAALVPVRHALARLPPPDLATLFKTVQEVAARQAGTLAGIAVMLVLVWIYGAWDAYHGGRSRTGPTP